MRLGGMASRGPLIAALLIALSAFAHRVVSFGMAVPVEGHGTGVWVSNKAWQAATNCAASGALGFFLEFMMKKKPQRFRVGLELGGEPQPLES
jgi:hypothetical protein